MLQDTNKLVTIMMITWKIKLVQETNKYVRILQIKHQRHVDNSIMQPSRTPQNSPD